MIGTGSTGADVQLKGMRLFLTFSLNLNQHVYVIGIQLYLLSCFGNGKHEMDTMWKDLSSNFFKAASVFTIDLEVALS